MSYNPERAKNPYRNNTKRRRRLDPHAGIKHSDIMKRQGLGMTVPIEGRVSTASGFSAALFRGDNFTVRSEAIGAGNNTGFGVNEEADRLYQVKSGLLYVFVEGPNGVKNILKVQPGDSFRAPRGLKHGISAAANADVEILVVEDVDYEATWQVLEDAHTRPLGDAVLASAVSKAAPTPAPITHRRTNQTKAKIQAAQADARRTRRKPKGAMSPAHQAAAMGNPQPAPQPMQMPTAAQTGTPAGRSSSGAVNLGHSVSNDANSGNAIGVNPRPMGPGRGE